MEHPMDHRRERIRCLQELGLHENASEDDIKKAYRNAAIKHHPDKNHGEDTTTKFQQISAAYRYLTEGDAYLQQMRHEARFDNDSILRFLFPWMFDPNFAFRQFNPFYNYYDEMSDSDDDEYEVYIPRTAYSTHAPSGASEHYQRNANFSQSSSQHGQFFQERNAKGKAAKKRNKEAKRATKFAADKERSEPAKTWTSNKVPQAKAERAKSQSPDLSGKNAAQSSPSRQSQEKSQTPDRNSTSNSTEARKDSTEEQTNKKSKKQIQMEQKQREKELKEIKEELLRQNKEREEKMEKKRLAQEAKERQEREAREEEEKEREEEEQKRAEELRQLLMRKDEEKKKKKKEAAFMNKLLEEFDSHTFLDDNGDFKYTDPEVKNIICRDDINHLGNVNENKQHKKLETINGLNTESLIKLQEVSQAKEKKQPKEEEQLGSPNHKKLGPIGSRPQNQFNPHKNPSGQQQNYQHASQQPGYQGRSPQHQHHPQQQHPHQHQQQHPQQQYTQQQHPHQHHQQQQYPYQHPQQFYNNPAQPQSTHQVPFWSPTQPPPPLHNNNTNIPRPSGRFQPGHPNNKGFSGGRVYTRTFSSQGFQGRV